MQPFASRKAHMEDDSERDWMSSEPKEIDRVLVERFLASRDEESFSRIYSRHTPMAYRFAFRMTGDEERASDAVQEAWSRATSALDRFAWRSSFRTWFTGIVLNCCRELERSRAANVDPPEPTHGAPQVARRVDLERAIARLADGYRSVLLLHDVEGFTHQEIGSILGLDTGTSKSQLSRARKQLRSELSAGRESSHG